MSNLISLKSPLSILNPNDQNTGEYSLNINEKSHLTDDFLLSEYEDDDDDSGFSCPCCLPR